MYKEFLENNFYKVALSVAVISACFISYYKTDNEPSLSFSNEFIGDPDSDQSGEKNNRCCKICGDELGSREDNDICKPCQEVNDIIALTEKNQENQEDQNEEYSRSFSPTLSRNQEEK